MPSLRLFTYFSLDVLFFSGQLFSRFVVVVVVVVVLISSIITFMGRLMFRRVPITAKEISQRGQ